MVLIQGGSCSSISNTIIYQSQGSSYSRTSVENRCKGAFPCLSNTQFGGTVCLLPMCIEVLTIVNCLPIRVGNLKVKSIFIGQIYGIYFPKLTVVVMQVE